MDDWSNGNRVLAALAVGVCSLVIVFVLTQHDQPLGKGSTPSVAGEAAWPGVPAEPSQREAAASISSSPTRVPLDEQSLRESADYFFYEPTGPIGNPSPERAAGPSSNPSVAARAGTAAQNARPRGPSVGAQAKPDRAVTVYDGENGRPVQTLTNPFGPQSSHPAFGIVAKRGQWLHVDLPTRPNGSQGWIKVDEVNLFRSDVSVDVDLAANRMVVFEADRVSMDVSVTTGTGQTPTPSGDFYVTDLLPDPGGVYGSYAFGLSGHSDVLTDFNGGNGQIAIHGTDRPDLMGRSASHGCVRVTNDLATALASVLTIGVRVHIG